MSLELGDRAFIIAEAGTCHAGPARQRLGNAMRYVEAAHQAGTDAVKFQMFRSPDRSTMFCWIEGDHNRTARWRASVMALDGWVQVKEFAEACSMMFLASTFEHETAKWLVILGVEATKVASRAAVNFPAEFPYGDCPRPFLISNGMDEVIPANDRIILECEAKYPSTLRWSGKYPGFSDHSGNPWRAIDAIARGCKLIEVHFYIKPLHAGPDLPASLTLAQLKQVCEARDAFAEINRKDETL